LAAKYHAGTAGKAAAQRIFAILDTPLPPSAHSAPATPAVVPFRSEIRFERVSVSYGGGQRQALRDLSFRIAHGQRVALVGATGAGKTTVANLLLRFVEPDRGAVTIDGISLGTLDRAAWRRQVAWVPQRPYLFYGTVADNIRLARAGATHAEVVAAATAAHAHGFIVNLPHGYDTLIGENGARLSGGEQQRLAVARAFLKDAPLLILDEATSHLDAESEAMIRDALGRLLCGRTALIIAHRLTMAYGADLVVVVREGRVVEEGTPRSLLSRGGDYRRLVAAYEGTA
jgi:ATP-binding cassette subfamily C protein CydD